MYKPNAEIEIAGRTIGLDHPTYFIADIAANHDGDFERAKDLIYLAADAGADVAKFQHFKAETIVSDQGFSSLPKEQMSHQAKWKKSVFEIYQDASINPDWTPKLKEICDDAGITFFTTPYAADLVEAVDPYVPAYKIGSGDITWPQSIAHVAGKGKPVILAAGASTMDDVVRGVDASLAVNPYTVLLQCNTNYTGDWDNFRHVQLNVLKSFAAMYPGMIRALSDSELTYARKEMKAKARTRLGSEEIENVGLIAKAHRVLEMAGWSAGASDDPEIFRLVEVDGLLPLLTTLTQEDKETKAAPAADAAAAGGTGTG